MANDEMILRMLTQQGADIAATKTMVEDMKDQNCDLFIRVRSLEDSRSEAKGRDEVATDVWGRLLGGAGVIGSMIASYFASRGGHG